MTLLGYLIFTRLKKEYNIEYKNGCVAYLGKKTEMCICVFEGTLYTSFAKMGASQSLLGLPIFAKVV